MNLIDRASGAVLPVAITPDDEDSDSPIWWKPDSSGFIFLKKPDGKEKRPAYFYHLERQDEMQLTAHGEAMLDIQWRPDGAGFYFIAAQQQPSGASKLLTDGWIIPPFESNANREIWYFDLASNAAEPVITGKFSVRQLSVSRDGQAVTYSRLPDHRYDSSYLGDVFVHTRGDDTSVRWTSNLHGEGAPQLSPNGQALAYAATVNEAGAPFHETKVFVKVQGEAPKRILPRMAMEALGFTWDRTGDGLFILGNTGLRANLYHYTLRSGELRQLTRGNQSLSDWSYDAATDTHIARIETAANPGEYQIMQDESEGFEPITSEYADWPDTFILPRQAAVSWRGR